jgi:hypothetical protein
MLLENMKLGENLSFMFQQINPSKFGVIINGAYIVAITTNRTRSRTPHIGENKLKRSFGHTKRSRERQLVTFSTLTCIIHNCRLRSPRTR